MGIMLALNALNKNNLKTLKSVMCQRFQRPLQALRFTTKTYRTQKLLPSQLQFIIVKRYSSKSAKGKGTLSEVQRN